MRDGLSEAEAYLMIESAYGLLTSDDNNHEKLRQWLEAYNRAAPLMSVAKERMDTMEEGKNYLIIMRNDSPTAVLHPIFRFTAEEIKARDEQPDNMRHVRIVEAPMIYNTKSLKPWLP